MTKTLAWLLATLTALSIVQAPALARNLDLLRSVPLDIADYPEARTFPATFATAAQVMSALNSTDNLLVHMEVIRRSQAELPEGERNALLDSLFKRHRAQDNNVIYFFDHGYAQMVHKDNKTGLFFLRKANDRLQNQFSALAYAMAQAEADVNEEATSPDEMTTRKLDVIFKMKDAIQRDKEKHQMGFWPAFVRVVDKLKPLPAYADFTRTDFSLAYVPYGNSAIPMRGATTAAFSLKATPDTLLSNAETTSCQVDGDATQVMNQTQGSAPVASRSVDFSNNGDVALIQFFPTNQEKMYRALVTNQQGQPLLSFNTPAYPHVVEDLEGDGTYELVIRQFRQDPFRPVVVYRLTPCGFELDKKIFSYFG